MIVEIYRFVLLGGSAVGALVCVACALVLFVRSRNARRRVAQFYISILNALSLTGLTFYFVIRFSTYEAGATPVGPLDAFLIIYLLVMFALIILSMSLTSVVAVIEQGEDARTL